MPNDYNHWLDLANALPAILGEMVDETASEAKANIQAQIRSNGQVKSGDMLNSIEVENIDKTTTQVSAGVPYAIFQEMGTRFMPPRAFFAPGMERTRDFFESKLGEFDTKVDRAIK